MDCDGGRVSHKIRRRTWAVAGPPPAGGVMGRTDPATDWERCDV